MADPIIFPGDVQVAGNLWARTFTPATGSIVDASVSAAAQIATSKLMHKHIKNVVQNHADSVVTRRSVAHVARFAGTIITFKIGLTAPSGSGNTATVDLLVNGSSVLTGVVTSHDTDAAFAKISGTINTPAYNAGDVIEVNVATTSLTGKGLFAVVELDEQGQ
jgi:hypothetical protein